MSTSLNIVESRFPAGLSVIEASAGTGKTYAISHLVPRLLLDGTVQSLDQILLVTFTNDAARELSDRVRRVLEKLAGKPAPREEEEEPGIHGLRERFNGLEHQRLIAQALLDVDRLTVSTIHSFCQRTIQAEGTLCGLPVMPEVITDSTALVQEALHDLWEERVAPDRLLVALANAGGWSLEADAKFVNRALSMEDFLAIPPAQPFEERLERIRHSPREFTPAMHAGLAGLVADVKDWKQGHTEPEFRQGHLKALAAAATFCDPGFAEALRWVAGLPGAITARSNAGKALKAAAVALPAVMLAGEILRLIGELQWDWQNACVSSVRQTVETTLRASRQITQDGLILTLRDALRSPKKKALAARLRERFRVALIDESQDTDSRQFEIFKNIFLGFDGETELPGHRLLMIGDPKQAIYGFRGADVTTYLEARAQARATFTLTTTYRSPQALVEAVNAFFSQPGSLLKEGLTFDSAASGCREDVRLAVDGQPCPGRLEAWIVSDGDATCAKSGERRERIIGAVASEIVHLLNAESAGIGAGSLRRVEPRDFAVLTNSNAEAEEVAAALKERGVPAIVASGEDVLATEEAADLLTILGAVHDPRRAGLRYAALATRLLGYDSAALREIRAEAAREEEILQRFLEWQAVWERKGVAAAIATMDAEMKITLRISSGPRGERRVTNFRQLVDLLQAASQEQCARPGHLLRWLAQEIARASDGESVEERQLQLESDSAAVQVVTMHKAKGLEYNLVFAPFLWAGREPSGVCVLGRSPGDSRDRLVNANLVDDPALTAALRRSALEDRLRLAYVAMTRAKVRLWIFGGEMGNGRGPVSASALDWLLRDKAVGSSPEEFLQWAESARAAGRGTRHSAAIDSLNSAFIVRKEPPAVTREVWRSEIAGHSGPLRALPAPERGEPWRVTSFSSLTREKNPHAATEPKLPSGQESDSPPNAFTNAPGGTFMGTAIHEWIQNWDFDEPDPDALEAHLRRFYPGSTGLGRSVGAMLGGLREAILPGLGCPIAVACPSREASEWHFHLPIRGSLSPQALAAVFAMHAAPEYQGYAVKLGNLPAEELQGLLQGFIDRLAFHGGSWGVIDWKTNNLGGTPAAYGPGQLLACAMESHYLLQAHLYLVALRRYLRQATPAAHPAGAWLVFLRAIQAGTGAGILHIHPGPEMLDALDALFYDSRH